MLVFTKKFLKFFRITALALSLIVSLSGSALAQDGDIDALVDDTKTDLLTVVGGGLAGAILGLSTLSFVEEPKEHTRNIVVGASIGIIAAVGYVALSQATKSQELIYGVPEEGASLKFNTKERRQWHASNNAAVPIVSPYNFSMSFSF